jgi:hypothetical protein
LETFKKKIGHWDVRNISLYYAFMAINGTLFGAKAFSNIFEDWVQVKYIFLFHIKYS